MLESVVSGPSHRDEGCGLLEVAVTWQEAMADFLRACSVMLEKNTVAYYDHQLRGLVRWAGDRGIPLPAFRARDMRDYLAYRADRGLSHKSRRHDALCARVFLRFCHREGYVDTDPLAGYQIPRAPRAYVQMPVPEELRRLLRAVHDYWSTSANPKIHYFCNPKVRRFIRDRDYAILVSLIDSGCRISEILNLRLADYKREARELHVREAKGDEPRVVPISVTGVTAIETWLRVRPARGCGDTLFVNQFGAKVDYAHFGKAFRHYRDLAGLSGWTLHGIRHYAATQLAKADVVTAAQVLGHKSLETTRGYLHRDADYARLKHAEANALGKVLVTKATAKKRAKVV